MKQYLKICILFFSITSYACDCDLPDAALEFYNSELVFEGKIISKIVAPDSLHYTIQFKIDKIHKGTTDSNTLSFTFEYQKKGHYDSCYWEACDHQYWLVYTRIYRERLTFDYGCSNSKPLDIMPLSKKEQLLLDNGDSFRLEHYIYRDQYDFNWTKPVSNIELILKKGKTKDYEKPYAWLIVFVDEKGNLQSVTTDYGYQLKIDSIFQYPTEFIVKLRKPLTEFQKEAISLVKKVKRWEIKRHKKTNIPVRYMQHIAISYDANKKRWNYEL